MDSEVPTSALVRHRLVPVRVAIAALFVAATLAACGGAEESPSDTTSSARNEDAGEQGGWWLYDGPGYRLVDGGLTPEDISASTGSVWRLEYFNSTQTIQLTGDRADSLFAQLSAASPQVGTATVDGVEAVLRQHPGSPERGIPPSVGAEWTDGDVFVSFGGGALTEEELRDHLSHVSRVSRSEWEAAVEPVAEQGGQTPPASPDTTGG